MLKNKNTWYVAWMDTFVYMVRFGLISWLLIYLLETKGFNKEQMGIAFWLFEWAAIHSTLLAGYISDKIFKGYRMPPAIGAMVIIFFMVIGYFTLNNLLYGYFLCSYGGVFSLYTTIFSKCANYGSRSCFCSRILRRTSWLYELCSRCFTWNKSL